MQILTEATSLQMNMQMFNFYYKTYAIAIPAVELEEMYGFLPVISDNYASWYAPSNNWFYIDASIYMMLCKVKEGIPEGST